MKNRDPYLENMKFLIGRINEINEWRNEAVNHASSKEEVDKIDARAFELRKSIKV